MFTEGKDTLMLEVTGFVSKRTEMHPHTLVTHWVLKLPLRFEAKNAALNTSKPTCLRRYQKEKKRKLTTRKHVQLFTHCSESAP